jgi:hypothetical protein
MKMTEQQRNRLADAEELFGYSPCMHCEHYDRTDTPGNKCKSFPNGIPELIFYGTNLHKKPYPGDNGIVFEDIDEE